jgi:hypothetical protein
VPANRYAFVEIECPETGRTLTVAKNTHSDPVGHLQFTPHQRAAAESYQADHEALSGSLRAPGDALGWRGHKPHADRLRQARNRLARAEAIVGPRRMQLIHAALIEGKAPADVQGLQRALNDLAEVYGLASRPRSRTTLTPLWRKYA